MRTTSIQLILKVREVAPQPFNFGRRFQAIQEQEHIATNQDSAVDALLRQIEWSHFEDTEKGYIPFSNDPASVTIVAQLRTIGESIYAFGGLDAIDEAILRITEMNSGFSDERSKLLEALWSPIGHEVETE